MFVWLSGWIYVLIWDCSCFDIIIMLSELCVFGCMLVDLLGFVCHHTVNDALRYWMGISFFMDDMYKFNVSVCDRFSYGLV